MLWSLKYVKVVEEEEKPLQKRTSWYWELFIQRQAWFRVQFKIEKKYFWLFCTTNKKQQRNNMASWKLKIFLKTVILPRQGLWQNFCVFFNSEEISHLMISCNLHDLQFLFKSRILNVLFDRKVNKRWPIYSYLLSKGWRIFLVIRT